MKKLILLILSFNLSLFLQAQNIEWLSFEQAIAQFNKEPKDMFIDVYTNWCGWCKRMDQTTFKEPEVVKLLSGNYYCVKVNAEMRNDLIFNNDLTIISGVPSNNLPQPKEKRVSPQKIKLSFEK